MRSKVDLTLHLIEYAYQIMADNVRELTLQEALFVPSGGYRSILGTLKHAAGWSEVYRSYVFDSAPKHWAQTDWPHGLRTTVIKSQKYVDDIIAWFDLVHRDWIRDLAGVTDDRLDEMRPLHWGEQTPLHDIVVRVAGHHMYHAGELNQVLSIVRGEAWEDGEEVEENNVATTGHRVPPPWKVD